MLKKDPEGYRKLLAYQKACELQVFTNKLVSHFSKTKTFLDLADQMSRSGRSGSKNIVEGWKRNTTKEYFDFLGFSIGAVEELKDDAADIATGVYSALMGVKGVTGDKGMEREVMGERGNPLPSLNFSAPSNPSAHLTPLSPSASLNPSNPLSPFFPLPTTRVELDKLKFYPLDPNLPPIVQLFLRAKEVNYLLYKLQQSLDIKMDAEGTKTVSQRARENLAGDKQADKEFEKLMQQEGLIRLPDGRYVKKQD